MLDIIIINYDTTDHLMGCLKSIDDFIQDIPTQVFVYDNNSQDGVDRVSAVFPHVLLAKNSRNMGFAKAINKALELTSAPYVLILNPDTIILRGFFQSLLDYMEENPGVGLVGPRILNHDGSIQESAKSFPKPLTALFRRNTLLTRIFPKNPMTRPNILTIKSDGSSPMEVDWISGACLLVRRKALEKVGPLDERFFLFWEDADWCRRMWQKGWKVAYCPKASVIHYTGVSRMHHPIRSIIEFHKSTYRFFQKHNKPSPWFLNPLVICALSLRMLFVISSNLIRILAPRQSHTAKRKKDAIREKEWRFKILRIIARLNIGGPAIHAHLLTRGLDSQRFQSILVTGMISSQEGDMSYLFGSRDKKPIILSGLQREIRIKSDLKVLMQIFRLLCRERPDIVHTHTAKAGTLGRIAVILYNSTHGLRIRLVHTFHGHIFEGYFSKIRSLLFLWIEAFLARFTDRIVAISETQKRELSEGYRIAPANKIKTIPLGFDLKPFLSSATLKGRFRRTLGLGEDNLLIGIIGRLVPIKNHTLLFDAARIFLKQNASAGAKFVVIGDGELRKELEAYCEHLDLADQVQFCGWIKDISSVYADLDILALTSLNEGTPVSIIEAMASSVPVIATDAGGVPDLLGPPQANARSDGFLICERGILCQKNDAIGFAKGLKYLAELDIREKQEYTAQARSFVESKFLDTRLLRDIESLYLELMRHTG